MEKIASGKLTREGNKTEESVMKSESDCRIEGKSNEDDNKKGTAGGNGY